MSQTTNPITSPLLTVAEVAKLLRVDDTTVRRWVKQGSLEAVILPHANDRQAYRIKRETLDSLLNTQYLGPLGTTKRMGGW